MLLAEPDETNVAVTDETNVADTKPEILPPVELSDEQRNAIDYVIEQLDLHESLIALSGPAGSGKTTLIKELIKKIEDDLKIPVVVAAMTNKAAFVLRTKGIPDAVTLHQACMKPKFRPPMDKLGGFLDQAEALRDPTGDPDKTSQNLSLAVYPYSLFSDFSREQLGEALEVASKSGVYSGFRHLGIKDIFKYIESWQPKDSACGVLIIDESSMIEPNQLDTVSSVYDLKVLVGDENQLPPIKGDPVFWNVKNRVSLTKVHRQAEGSQPLNIATALRNGETVVPDPLVPIDVELSRKGYPVIVWRNRTRETLTGWIREKLGYSTFPDGSGKPLGPQVGEVLICRNSQDKSAKARGLINNSLWRVGQASGFRVDLENDQGEKVKNIHVHMEELNEGMGVPFRFAYALTAHSAQGSQWEEVMIHQPDAAAYCSMNPVDARKWIYTAATRAAKWVHWTTGMVKE
jgi:exodeoxyribonuclease-5